MAPARGLARLGEIVLFLGFGLVGVIDSGGGLAGLDNPAGANAWWGSVQAVFFPASPRMQLKWLLSGATVFIVAAIGLVWLNNATGVLRVLDGAAGVGTLALPVSIGFGILKFRLYDIDRIVSRTLAYAIVTGLLVGVYAGLVLLATQVFRFHNSVAVAAATLVAAALFHPARRRGPARGRPPVQPGQVRRGPDGGGVRGPAAGRGGPGHRPLRPAQHGRPGAGARSRHGVDGSGGHCFATRVRTS